MKYAYGHKNVEQADLFGYYCFADKKYKEGRLSHMYIITYAIELENQKNYEIRIEPPPDFTHCARRR